jgi:hypothetical protein
MTTATTLKSGSDCNKYKNLFKSGPLLKVVVIGHYRHYIKRRPCLSSTEKPINPAILFKQDKKQTTEKC